MDEIKEICGATTGALNCGCCETVIFSCQLEKGHEGSHKETSSKFTYNDKFEDKEITVTWDWNYRS